MSKRIDTPPSGGDDREGRADDTVSAGVPAPLPESVAPPGTPTEPGFLDRGKTEFKTMLREAANYKELKKTPYGLKPILVFVTLGAVASLDGRIFGQAAPEIIRDLDIDLISLNAVLSIVGFFLIFGILGLAYLADRVPRTPLVGAGAILSGIFSLFTAGSSTLPALGASRAGDQVGSVLLDTPIGSLEADYYPPESRGKAIALRGVVARIIGLIAPLLVAGLVLWAQDGLYWRLPFLITGPLMIVMGVVVMLVLKEPIRGYMERRSLGVSEEVSRQAEDTPSFGEAWRTIWAIRTLRRLFISDIPGNTGDILFNFAFALFIFEFYGLNIGQRAVIGAMVGLFALPFGFMAGGMVDVLMRRRPSRVLVLSGVLAVVSGLFLFVIASGPPLWILVGGFMLFGAASALLGPARQVLFLNILPAHVRTLGVSVRVLAYVPAQIIRLALFGWIFTRYGLQGVMVMSVPFIMLSGLIDLTAAPMYERDVRAAIASQLASSEWRRAKAAGRGKLLVCRDVDVEYSGVQVLFGVDFDVEEGQIIALLGTNGAGKSTLLQGHQRYPGGFERRRGLRRPGHHPHASARGGCPRCHTHAGRAGGVPGPDRAGEPDPGQLVVRCRGGRGPPQAGLRDLPCPEGAAGGARPTAVRRRAAAAVAGPGLPQPPAPADDRRALAGAVPGGRPELIEIVKEINRQGTTVIVVEQSVNVALTLADRAIFMEKGEVKFFGETEELLRRPDILRAVYVKGTGALTEGAPSSGVKSEREMRRYEIESARVVLEVKNVGKSFGGVTAVKDVSLQLREGEALGLIGPNGAGKTTLFDLISGYQIPDGGSIVLDGVDITQLPAEARAKLRLVRRFQDARLFPSSPSTRTSSSPLSGSWRCATSR
jgi:ABC-type branched-subunit amino acid transport system ATPase component